MVHRLSTFSMRHRWSVIGLWLLVAASVVLAAPYLFDRLTADVGDIDGTESQRGYRMLAAADPDGDRIYASVAGFDDLSSVRADIARTAAEVSRLPGIESVVTPWTGRPRGEEPALVSSSGETVAVVVQLAPTRVAEESAEEAAEILRTIDAPAVLVGGGPLLDVEMNEQAASDLARAELISMPVMLVLLLLVFGGVIAAGLPMVIALVAVLTTLVMMTLLSALTDVSVYSVNIITMLGLGLAVDYALLIVTRFREERAETADVDAALERTMITAGRTVAFSGLTVAASLAGLLVFQDAFLRSMGFAGMAVVALDMLAALTLLPALLAFVGRRIQPASTASTGGGVFVRLARWYRLRPLAVIGVIAALLAIAASPFVRASYSDPDERSLPASAENRQLAETARSEFPHIDIADPVMVVGPALSESALKSLRADLADVEGVADVDVSSDLPLVVEVAPSAAASDHPADLVREVRELAAPLGLAVTGDAAELVDYEDAIVSRIPWAFGVIVLATFVLLFLMTGSVVIPVKALILNALSLGAAFGALVWVFQDGHLAGLVGSEALGSLSVTTPVIVFAIAFGLSMDYEVFLLGRISEIWRQTGNTDLAVELGLQRTGRVVTAAALLMIVVYAGFIAGGFAPIKQVGLGLVLAVAVDATLVRMLLLPATMSLLGAANWWSPAPLCRWYARHGWREDADPPVKAEPTPALT